MSFFTTTNITQSRQLERATRERVVTVDDLAVGFSAAAEECGLDEKDAARFMSLTVGSADAEMMSYFYAHRSSKTQADKPVVRMPTWLSDDQKAQVREYAPEYELLFSDTLQADHCVAASTRAIDYEIVKSMLPDVRYDDIGGNPLVYMRNQTVGVHVCSPTVDVKDMSRKRKREMAMKAMERRTVDVQKRREMQEWLNPASGKMCELRAQDCTHRTEALVSIHVYDIPLADWPDMLEKRGAKIAAGCLLFSDELFMADDGVMPMVNAEWRVDRKADVFQMGFVGSSAWWYKHKYSEYVKYGSKQILVSSSGRRYLYDIVSRRGDTIFFTVTETTAAFVPAQFVERPTIRMVRVHGYDLRDQTNKLVKKVWHFPMALWERLLNYCVLQYEKGTLNLKTVANMYRTFAARQSVNGVLIAGGERVVTKLQSPMIVHAAICATIQCYVGRTETQAITRLMVERRNATPAAHLSRVVRNLFQFSNPADHLFSGIRNMLDSALSEELVSWVTEGTHYMVRPSQMLPVLISQVESPFGEVRAREAKVEPVDFSPLFVNKKQAGPTEVIVREHIAEVEAELLVTQLALSHKRQRFMGVDGKPNVSLLRMSFTNDANPDFVQFVDGKAARKSVLGKVTERLEIAAVLTGDGSITPWVPGDPIGNFTGYGFFTDDLRIYNGPQIVNALNESLPMLAATRVVLHAGPPGCGKTTEIVRLFDRDTDVVLCPVRESIQDTAARLVEDGKMNASEEARFTRTIDSYLINHATKPVSFNASRLLVDECFMTHAARILAAACMMGVREVHAFGDPKQIPHVTRSDFVTFHATLVPDEVVETYVSYRCPPNAVAAWNHMYENRVRSKGDHNALMWEGTEAEAGAPDADDVLLTMYQADKVTVKSMHPHVKRVMTVHEAQGKTFKHVRLYKFESRARNDKASLFDNPSYVLVAMSRHTSSFKFIRPLGVGDCVSKFIANVTAANVDLAKSDGQTTA